MKSILLAITITSHVVNPNEWYYTKYPDGLLNIKNMKTTQLNTDVIRHAIDGLANVNVGTYGCDLHNELFNTDYFIIGYYKAEQFLKSTDEGIFGAIELIKDYEQDNFGQVSTDFSSSEKVANMYAYIIGEQVLAESQTLQANWDKRLTDEDLAEIKAELENLL